MSVLALGVAGCDCGGGGAGDRCDTNADCDPGLVCDPITSTCQSGVDDGGSDGGPLPNDAGDGGSDSGDAGGGATDSAVTDSGPGSLGATGAACTADTECAETPSGGDMVGCLPELFGFAGGYCTNGDCDTGLQDCPGGDALCYADAMGDTFCLDQCDPANGDADCRAGYNCFDLGLFNGTPGSGPFGCLPFCADNADCDATQMCDTMTFTCFTPGAGIGDPCVLTPDCPAGAFCISESTLGFPGGYCIAPCDFGGAATCPSGGTCYETDDPATMPEVEGTCLADCMMGGPGGGTCARMGYACTDQFFGTMLMDNACLPACMDSSVCTLPGNECEVIIGLCQPPVDPAQFGESCVDESGCVGGICATEGGMGGPPMGSCFDECDPAGAPADCPTGGTCVDLAAFGGPPFGLCFVSCDPVMPMCRPGYDCSAFLGDVCVGDCQASSECFSGCCEMGFPTNNCVDPAGATCL